MLWLSLHFAQLPLAVYTRAEQSTQCPVVIYTHHKQRRWVHACNASARGAGIEQGMRLSTALSIQHAVQLHARDPAAEQQLLQGIAGWAGQFTSMISLQSPDTILLEIEGSLKLFGGLHCLRKKILAGLQEMGHHAKTAVAPTPLAALLLCRAGDEIVVGDRMQLHRRLAALPIEWLEQAVDQAPVLRNMGLHTIGHCLRLPRADLAQRLGQTFIDHLDRAMGNLADPRRPYEPPPRFVSHLALPAQTHESTALLFAARRLLLELSGFLRACGQGVQGIDLELIHRNGPITLLSLAFLRPRRDAAAMLELLRERLQHEKLRAPVEEIRLRADTLISLVQEHTDLFNTPQSDSQTWAQLQERLQARLGKTAVQGLQLHEDHRPEQAWSYCRPGETNTARSMHARRPLWLLETPRPLQLSHDVPCLDGPLHLLQGPERIESGWWDKAPVGRDYFIAQTLRKERVWIFRELDNPQQWFLHGLFA